MAAEAVLVLIDDGGDDGDSVVGADAGGIFLGDAVLRRRREDVDLSGAMSVVAIDAGGMAIIVELSALGSIVRVGGRGKRMSDFGGSVLGEDTGRSGCNIGAAIVTGDAILLVLTAKKARGALSVVRRVAGNARVLRDSRVTS